VHLNISLALVDLGVTDELSLLSLGPVAQEIVSHARRVALVGVPLLDDSVIREEDVLAHLELGEGLVALPVAGNVAHELEGSLVNCADNGGNSERDF